jgi:ABC-type nitrate/sulfonate/bicarbonate transport system permease component
MTSEPRRAHKARRLQIVTLLCLLALWELVSLSGIIYRGVVPSWAAIVQALFGLLTRPSFWANAAVTLSEIALALFIGSVAGILAGLAIGSSRLAAAATEPIINAFASTPKVIFLPLLYLVFGIGMSSKIAVGALGSFFPMVVGVVAAMLQMNPVMTRVGRSFGLSRTQMIRKIYLPSLVEPIRNALRIAVGVAISACLIAETRFSFAGLGFMVFNAFERSRFAEVYAVLVMIFALAALANILINRLTGRYSR